MLNCLNTPGNLVGDGTDISVLERQRVRLKWHQEQQQLHHHHHEPLLSGSSSSFFSRALEFPRGSELQDLMSMSRSADHGFGDGWPVVGKFQEVVNGTEIGMNYGISRTASCPPKVAAIVGPAVEKETTAVDGGGRDSSLEKLGLGVGKESFRKRKAGKVHNSKVAAEGEAREKRTKGCTDDHESKITEQNRNISSNNSRNRETSSDTSKDNSKVSQKPDYIHVRARRGQATDSHSLAERVRRERISERMKYLQDLVPGCNKITGKAGMLDEIINYVQSLQRQVEFLSMKLAAVNPRLDFNIDNFLTKEVLPPCAANFPTISISPELANPAYLQYNSMQQAACSGLEMGANPHELGFPRTVCPPISIPETFVDSSCFTQIQPSSTWDAELQSLYSEDPQGRSTPFLSQPFTGSVEAGNLKVEM